jgi:16S rRNA (adenine1518-N6/adenine1519-N6)-dimethyltransferase
MAIDDLPPLRLVIAAHGLAAKKALGQNFLLDLNLTSRIARASGALDGVHVVEVGPGPGGLTRALLAAGAASVTAIETDPRCLPALAEIAARYPGRLDVVAGDALRHDMAALAGARRPARIVANLPYNIAAPLIIGWLKTEPWPPWFDSITVMVQREFADRLVARPDRVKDYGRLSVLTAMRATAKILFNVPPAAFTPQPKVMSSVVRLEPLAAVPDVSLTAVEQVTAAAFGQRRKMLRQSLKALGDAAALLDAAGIPPEHRAENVPPEGFVRLAQALAARSASAG